MKAASIVALALIACAAQAAQMYKWVDKDGKVQYTDHPPPTGAAKSVEQRKMQGNVIQSSEVPYGVRETVKNFPVTLWANDCGEYCNKARELLNKRGVPFAEKDPQKPENTDAFKKTVGSDLQIPVMQVGQMQTVKGFEDSQWNAALDAAGYPRTNPGIKPPAPKPAATTAAPAPLAQPAPEAQNAPAPKPPADSRDSKY